MRVIQSDLTKLANNLYKDRDVSHGIHHVSRVRDNAMLISRQLNITDSKKLAKIEAAALFHDLWDHKYVSPLSNDLKNIKKKLNEELKIRLFSEDEIKDIEVIIDNVSLSREMQIRKNNKIISLNHLQLIRDIVSDADKLEMLGLSGIDRIVKYQMHKYPNTKSEEIKNIVKNLYNNKISKLLDENYIKTKPGREMAIPLMKEMKNFIERIN